MGKCKFGLIATLVALACAPKAWAESGFYGNGDLQHPLSSPSEWPMGANDLVNRAERIGGFFSDDSSVSYFVGGTGSLNSFLAQYAELQGTPLTLVLHVGQAQALMARSKKKEAYNWQFDVLSNKRERDIAAATAKQDATLRNARTITPYTITVHVWLGGQVDLMDLKVPNNIEVKSGGEIENFIAHHHTK